QLERVAVNTKPPELLTELFAALGNDPFVIAECLIEPVVAERLVQECNRGASPGAILGDNENPPTAARVAEPPGYQLPKIAGVECITDSWTATNFIDALSG